MPARDRLIKFFYMGIGFRATGHRTYLPKWSFSTIFETLNRNNFCTLSRSWTIFAPNWAGRRALYEISLNFVNRSVNDRIIAIYVKNSATYIYYALVRESPNANVSWCRNRRRSGWIGNNVFFIYLSNPWTDFVEIKHRDSQSQALSTESTIRHLGFHLHIIVSSYVTYIKWPTIFI
jgi:hypothetical protein